MGQHPWYRTCTAYRQAPEASRKSLSAPARSNYLRIARLPDPIGLALDGDHAPFRVYRFVAWGEGPAAIGQRHALVRRLVRELRRWPMDGQMYEALADAEGPSSKAG